MIWRLLAIALTVILPAAVPTADAGASSVRTVTVSGRSYANLYDVAMRYSMRFARTKTARVLSGRSDRLTVYQEKRYMFLNGVRISQCFSPIVRAGTVYVSSLDLSRTIDPLLGSRKGFRHSIRTIMLDIGHGGKDRGAAGRSSLEKDITLRLGRRLAAVLRACGYRVILTRNSDIYLDLDRRSALQRKYDADLFLSLHINSAADRSVKGIETFCLTPAGAPSSNGGKVVWTKYNGNAYDSNNIVLAYNIQRSLLARTGATDRGVKRARFAVLRDIRCPGALIEVGFLSNRQEELNLNSAAYIEKLARGIADGVIKYHHSLSR